MSKNLVRKIIATVFFILSVFFMWKIFGLTSENQLDNGILINFGALFLSNLFLFVLIYTFQTEIVYEKEKKTIKQPVKEDVEEKISKTEHKIKNVISELNDVKNEIFPETFLKVFAKEFHIVQAVVYVKNKDKYISKATYAFYGENKIKEFSEGQGITGQTALNKKIKIINDIPEGYINVVSGLGASSPKYLLLIPFTANNETIAVAEFASFDAFPDDFEKYHSEFNRLTEKFKI